MRMFIGLFVFLFPCLAQAASWKQVSFVTQPDITRPVVDPKAMSQGVEEAAEVCLGKVSCRVAISSEHSARQDYADLWYSQCQKELRAADADNRLIGEVSDLRAQKGNWMVAPDQKGSGVGLMCYTEPDPTPPIPPTPPKVDTGPKLADQPPAEVSTTLSVLFRDLELEISVTGETFYQVDRGEPDGLILGGFGLTSNPADWLLLGARFEIGSAVALSRGGEETGHPYFWFGGRALAAYRLTEMFSVGGLVQFHRGVLGLEPHRDRFGFGIHFLAKDVWKRIGIEAQLIVARDHTPAFEQTTVISYTEGTDLTLGLTLGLRWWLYGFNKSPP